MPLHVCPQAKSGGGICSVEVPSAQMTLACGEVTRTLASTERLHHLFVLQHRRRVMVTQVHHGNSRNRLQYYPPKWGNSQIGVFFVVVVFSRLFCFLFFFRRVTGAVYYYFKCSDYVFIHRAGINFSVF